MSSVVFTEVYSRYQGPNLTDEQVRDLNARARIRIAAEKAEKNRLKQEKKLAKANKKGKADLAAHRFGELQIASEQLNNVKSSLMWTIRRTPRPPWR